MIDNYSGLLQFYAQYNQQAKRLELKSISNQSPADFLAGVDVDDAPEANVNTYYTRTPWLFRGIELRANAVGAMPFRIMRGDVEVDNSEKWTNAVGFLPDPGSLLWLTEAALCLWGMAYYWREKNRVKGLPLRYIVPSTIEPVITETAGLTGFWRTPGATRKWATTDDVVYLWKPDPYVEIGPPQSSPVMAAMSAAGVLFNIDAFAAAFFQRGAIKATMLTVEGNPAEPEKDRLKDWWKRAVGGINNAFNANVFSMSVKPVTVGEGLESLTNSVLTADKRADVATALGIPQTILFSADAGGLGGGGVVRQDDVHFYDKTVVPECRFIAGVLNTQIFAPLGLRLAFMPETLDVFQADENNRAAAFAAYVGAGLPKSLTAEMLGLELPEGWEYADLDPEEPEPEPMAPATPGEQPAALQDAQPGEDVNSQVDAIVVGLTKAAVDDLRAWRRKSHKRGKLAEFESATIPVDVMDAIKARSDNGWRQAMDEAIDGAQPVAVPPAQVETVALVDALRAMTEALLKDA